MLDFSYRYACLGEAEWDNSRTDDGDPAGSSSDITAHEFLAALRFSF